MHDQRDGPEFRFEDLDWTREMIKKTDFCENFVLERKRCINFTSIGIEL